jgi:hypothetical protein
VSTTEDRLNQFWLVKYGVFDGDSCGLNIWIRHAGAVEISPKYCSVLFGAWAGKGGCSRSRLLGVPGCHFTQRLRRSSRWRNQAVPFNGHAILKPLKIKH